MRKRFLLLLFLAAAFFAAATESLPDNGWVPLYFMSNSDQPTVTTTAARNAHMTVQLNIPGFELSKVWHNFEIFDRVTLPEQCQNLELGSPNVPVMREIISVPEGSVLRINVTDVKYKRYSNITLEPAQRELDEGETEADREFRRDETLYSTNGFYPANWVDSSELGKHREVNLTTLNMNPVRYNPVTKELQVAYSITYDVEFVGYSRYNVSDIPEHLEETYKGMLLNYDYMNYELRTEQVRSYAAQPATDYLIIAASNLVNSPSLKNLVKYHEGEGRVVEVRDVATMGKTADEIRKVIQQIYDQATPAELDYLLLVGDTDTIPIQKWAYYDYRSDVWYGYLEGGDKIADVGVGRFPARNETELANMVRKTLNFQTNANPGPWQQRGLFVAHEQQYPGKYTECKESIINHTYKLPAPEFIRIYGGDKTKNWTNADLIKEINKGALVINYRGHGQKDHWHPWNKANEAFSTKDVYSLKNGNMTPVVFNIACYNGDIEYSPESLIEAMIRHPNGGAVAALGATNLSGTTANHDFDRALFFGTWDLGINSIGDLLNYGIAEVLKKHGMSKNVVIYLWVGDPALSLLRKNGPVKMRLSTDVVGQGTITLNPAGGVYDRGAVVTATAKADKGWKFTGWSGDATGQTATTTVTMSSHRSLTATFTRTELEAPANLTAKAAGFDKITLNWSAVAGAESYIVYSSATATGTYSEVATVKTASATVEKLLPETTYYFKVKARTATLTSNFSAQVSATTEKITPSAPVVTITSPADNAEIFTKTTATIKVVATVTDINGDLRSVTLGTEQAVVAGDSYTFTITNVAPGRYTYLVEAVDAGGLKGQASVTVTVKEEGACTLPSWDPKLTYKGGEVVCHNKIHYKAGWWHKGSEPGASQWGPWEKVGECGGGTTPVNQAPEVSISSPANNASFQNPATFQIVAVAKDSDGTVAKVEIFQNTQKLGYATAGSNNSYTFDVVNLAIAGTYRFRVVATDDKGATKEAGITVIVKTGGINPGNAWVQNKAYKVGDVVTYNGKSYKCTFNHTSLRGWEPSNAPTLWTQI